MMVEIRRTGGFAGVEEKLASVDSRRLPEGAAAELARLVARLSAWCARNPESEGADRFRYEIEIAEPGALPRTLAVVDEGDPQHPAVKDVLALLDLVGGR